MALSGTINGTVTNKASIFSFYLVWSATQSISENCSYVTVTSYFGTSNTAHRFDTYGTRECSITINGTKATEWKRLVCNPWSSDKKYAIQSVATFRVPHNTDGTKSIVISASADGTANSGTEHYGPSYDSSQPCTASATVTLNTIVRCAYITSAPDFTDQENPTITFANPLGSAITSIEACISTDGTTASVPYRAVSLSGGEYTFELTTTEKTTLRTASSTNQMSVYFVLKSVYNGTTYTNSSQQIFYVEDSEDTRPSVSLSVSPDNSSLPSTFSGLYIQGKTKISGSVTAAGKFGATIEEINSCVRNKWYTGSTFLSDALDTYGEVSISSTATDSRDIADSASATVTYLAYTKPQVVSKSGETEVKCYRSNSSGTAQADSTSVWIKAKKSFSSLSSRNTCQLRWRSKLSTDASYGAWTYLTTTDDEYSGLISGTFATASAYSIQIGVVDGLTEENALTMEIVAFTPTFHMGAGGDRIGVGRYAQNIAKSFSVASDWKSYFPGGLFGFLRGAEAVPYWQDYEPPLMTLYNSGTPGFFPFVWGDEDNEWGVGVAIMGIETSTGYAGIQAGVITLGFGSYEINCYEIDSEGLNWLGRVYLSTD